MTKTYKHDTPYGIVYETYEIAKIIQAVDDNIAERYEQGEEPRNLALELLRLQNQLLIERGC